MMVWLRSLFAGAVGCAWVMAAGDAVAQSDAAKAFGAREMVLQASLSPDGKTIAMIQPLKDAQASALMIAPLDGSADPKPILAATGHPDRFQSCHWASNSRLVCEIGAYFLREGVRLGFSRLMAINPDGSDTKLLTATSNGRQLNYAQNGGDVIDWLADGPDGSVLMTRNFIPEFGTGSHLANDKQGLGVERVDTVSLKRVQLEIPRLNALDYLSDQHGTVRIVIDQQKATSGYNRARYDSAFRPAGGGPWAPLASYDADDNTGFMPQAVDRDLNAVYGFEYLKGRRALYRVTLDKDRKHELVLSHDDVDIDSVIRIGRTGRVVGATYVTEKRERVFFDPALQSLSAALSKALPGHPAVSIVEASADENRLLIHAGSDVDPGAFYLYDRKTHELGPIMSARPALAKIKLAEVRPITYRAADGTMVPGYLTLPPQGPTKNIPAIVMPHGGPSARDEWGFDWLAQFFANRGFAVLQPNFRGSAGYGEGWFRQNGFQSWRSAIGDVNDAGRWLGAQGIAAPGKLAIVGWSYGGYAALQSAVLDPNLFKAIVAIAPVTDLDSAREEKRNFTNFRIVDNFIGHGPHVKEGSPAQNAEKITAPVLMFHGDEDANVSVAESRLMLARLKSAGRNAELVVFPGLDHQLDDSAARAQMLDKSDTFIRTALGL